MNGWAWLRRWPVGAYLAVALTTPGCPCDDPPPPPEICAPSPTDLQCPAGWCWHADPTAPSGGVCEAP